MHIAVIDLGTNTFNLLIVDVGKSKEHKKLFQAREAVKLGKDGIIQNRISEKAFLRGLDVIQEYKNIITRYAVDKAYAVGTSAIRSALNGKEFADAVKTKTGIDVRIISGEKEAEYIYYGVRNAFDLGNSPSLIMDIGGGSIEFVIANNKTICWKYSYDLGIARILETFAISDPIKPEEVKTIEHYLEKELIHLFEATKKHMPSILVGSSGSFDTFAEMIAHRFYTPDLLKGKTHYLFNMEEYGKIHEQLLKSTIKERLLTKGLVAMRADMIVPASVFVNFLLQRLSIHEMHLSTYALKEGALNEILNDRF